MNWIGRWGSSEHKLLGRIGGGPGSPSQQNPKWGSPARWHARIRGRKLWIWLGSVLHGLGNLSAPAAPSITEAAIEGSRVKLRWELGGSGLRRGRHLYATLHAGHRVISSRVLANVEPQGEVSLLIPSQRQPTAAMLSVYNQLRQRSDLVAAELTS